MKTPTAPDTQTSSRAAAHTAPANGTALPAVQSELEAPKEDLPLTEASAPEVPLALDMNDDGEAEPHTLFINPDDGELWLHSDKETLSTFLERKYSRRHETHLTEEAKALLIKIKADAVIVHEGTYSQIVPLDTPRKNSHGKIKTEDRKQPSVIQRALAKAALTRIANNLQLLHQASNPLMKKSRPLSFRKEWSTHEIDGTRYCNKIVMEPLSILPREDGIAGSQPENDGSAFFTRLTQLANYKRGHMLNEHLHGPGTADNLVPISTAFNNKMRTSIEQATKDAVNANNKVVRFEAEPRGWGNYKGGLNAPDEKKLPEKFWFHVQQMQLIPGKEGNKKEDWAVSSKPAIFKEEMEHTPPSDFKKGAVAPGTITFKEGYYFSAEGKCIQESATLYQLSGSFYANKNSFEYLFKPLGLDPSIAYTEEKHDLKVTTRFELPAGLEMVKGDLDKVVEIIAGNTTKLVDVTGTSFVIIKSGTRKAHQDAYKLELQKFKDDQKLIAEKEERERAEKQRAKSASSYSAPTDKAAPMRSYIQKQYEAAQQKYKGYLSDEFSLQFGKESDALFEQAMKKWQIPGNLTTDNMDKEKDALLSELGALYKRLEQRALEQADRGKFIAGILEELNTRSSIDYRSGIPRGPQRDEFDKAAGRIFESHKRYWKAPENSHLTDREKMLRSALQQLKEAYEKALQSSPQPGTSSPKRKLDTEEEKTTVDNEGKEKEKDDQQGSATKKNKTSHEPGAFRLNNNNNGGGPPPPSSGIAPFQPQNTSTG